ncbi:MAG TPA: hypothetical protein VF457_15600 [Burkholderiaceae bacterium]
MSYVQDAIMVTRAIGAWQTAIGAGQQAQEQRRAGYAVANANEERVRRRDAQQLGAQRAAAAESGFDPNSGSLATAQAQSSGNLELDALTARYAGQVNAWRMQQTIFNQKPAILTGGVAAAGDLYQGYADYGSGGWRPVSNGSDPNGYNGTQNNPSAYVAG